jgi:hypothetical protein
MPPVSSGCRLLLPGYLPLLLFNPVEGVIKFPRNICELTLYGATPQKMVLVTWKIPVTLTSVGDIVSSN